MPHIVTPSPGMIRCTSKPLPVRNSIWLPIIRSARSMSSCVVTLKLRSEPITKVTGMPAASATAASSVSSPPATLRCAARIAAKWNACGVWARHRSRRSTVSPTRSPAPRLMVSTTGTATRMAGCCASAVDGAADGAAIDQRPRGVVDQHIVRPLRRQPLQAVQHRALPRRAAVDRRQQLGDAGGRRVIEIALRGMDRHHDAGDAGMRGEGLQAVAQHRLAGERLVLLREVAAKALTAAGGDDKNERAS